MGAISFAENLNLDDWLSSFSDLWPINPSFEAIVKVEKLIYIYKFAPFTSLEKACEVVRAPT